MIWAAMSPRDATGLYFIPPNTTINGVCGIAEREVETAPVRPRLKKKPHEI